MLTFLVALLVLASCNIDPIKPKPKPTPVDPVYSTPLTFEFLKDNGEFTLNRFENYGDSDVYYSLNDGKKTLMLFGESNAIKVSKGDTIALYRDFTPSKVDSTSYISFDSDTDCAVYGNVMSLIDSENFANANEVPAYAFYGLFKYNYYMQSHDSIKLVLPAQTLGEYCYAEMFNRCPQLTKAPSLRAETLVEGCYEGMFGSCEALRNITCLATNIDASAMASGIYTKNWVDGVSYYGKFYRNSDEDDWTISLNGIPTGSDWTVYPELPTTI